MRVRSVAPIVTIPRIPAISMIGEFTSAANGAANWNGAGWTRTSDLRGEAPHKTPSPERAILELADEGSSEVDGVRLTPGVWLHNRKRPAGEAGRFWGYYREERAADGQAQSQIRLARAKSVRLSPAVAGRIRG
jgi:hypothetical protein